MFAGRFLLVAGVSVLGLLLSGCGFRGSPFALAPVVPVATTPAEKLEGNWLVYGKMPRLDTPIAGPNATEGLTLSLSPDGTHVTGAAFLSGTCTTGEPFLLVFGNAISVVPDGNGNFSTSSTQTFGWGFTLTGTAPSLQGKPWTGTYEIKNTLDNNVCAFAGSGTFTATPVGQMTGTFTGSGTVGTFGGDGQGLAAGSPLHISLTTVQGSTYQTFDGKSAYNSQLLDGTIQVNGISCFTSGTSSTVYRGKMLGNEFLASFNMDDDSMAYVVGTIDNTATTQVLLNDLSVVGGKCAGNYGLAMPGAMLSR